MLQVGQHYDMHKNRVNDQVIKQMRDEERPEFCPVQASLDIVDVALHLGQTKEDNPLCVFETEDGTVQYLTGDMITKYYRWVTAQVFPQISKEDLKLISCHSIRVTAAVILHLAGKDPSYIKLRLRWLSDCFQGYLRNTKRISAQHTAAVSETNMAILKAMEALHLHAKIPERPVYKESTLDKSLDLEDKD